MAETKEQIRSCALHPSRPLRFKLPTRRFGLKLAIAGIGLTVFAGVAPLSADSPVTVYDEARSGDLAGDSASVSFHIDARTLSDKGRGEFVEVKGTMPDGDFDSFRISWDEDVGPLSGSLFWDDGAGSAPYNKYLEFGPDFIVVQVGCCFRHGDDLPLDYSYRFRPLR